METYGKSYVETNGGIVKVYSSQKNFFFFRNFKLYLKERDVQPLRNVQFDVFIELWVLSKIRNVQPSRNNQFDLLRTCHQRSFYR